MTKQKALEEMTKTSRCLIDPKQAEKWAKAFGTTLENLCLVPRKTKDFYRVTPYSEADAEKLSIPTFAIASTLVEKVAKGTPPQGIFYGQGTNAEWITEGCVKILQAL